MIVIGALLGYLEAVALPVRGSGILLQDIASEIGDRELEVFVDLDAESVCGETLGLRRYGDTAGP